MRKIILIGFATSGKSSVGKLLAERIGAEFVDTDVEIERQCGMSVGEIFDQRGEAYFRQRENEILSSFIDRQNVVVACGGGSVLSESFTRLADHSFVVLLTATVETVHARLGDTPRPLFDGRGITELQRLIAERAPLYRRYADVTFPTDNLTPSQLAELILKSHHLV